VFCRAKLDSYIYVEPQQGAEKLVNCIYFQELFANILCPEEQPMFCDSLISQLNKLMSLDYPTPETHGSLMSDQFQNLWVMAVLREELELVQNLLLYIGSCELQLKSFLKLFKTILVRCLLNCNCIYGCKCVQLLYVLCTWCKK
jgi:hypothetical protein